MTDGKCIEELMYQAHDLGVYDKMHEMAKSIMASDKKYSIAEAYKEALKVLTSNIKET